MLSSRQGQALGCWCAEHDDRNSFIFPYLALSVVLSFIAGLFWLVVLVAVHFALEIYRHRSLPMMRRIGESLFGIKLDFALIFVALALGLYLDLLFGLLGLNAIARAGALSGRFAGRIESLRRIARSAMMLSDEVVRVGGFFVASRGIQGIDDVGSPGSFGVSSWFRPWSLGTWTTCAVFLVAVCLIAAAPSLTGLGFDGTIAAIAAELHPFAH